MVSYAYDYYLKYPYYIANLFPDEKHPELKLSTVGDAQKAGDIVRVWAVVVHNAAVDAFDGDVAEYLDDAAFVESLRAIVTSEDMVAFLLDRFGRTTSSKPLRALDIVELMRTVPIERDIVRRPGPDTLVLYAGKTLEETQADGHVYDHDSFASAQLTIHGNSARYTVHYATALEKAVQRRSYVDAHTGRILVHYYDKNGAEITRRLKRRRE
jgi:hypothetical protein